MVFRPFWTGLLALLVASAVPRCGCSPDPRRSRGAGPAPGFDEVAARIMDEQLEAHPARGVSLGLHDYDGRLPDVSGEFLEQEARRLKFAVRDLSAFERAALTPIQQVELAALLASVRGDLFELEVRVAPFRNPMYYTDALALTAYVSRDYAPLAQRAEAVAAIARATPQHLAHAKRQLATSLPRTFIATALLQTRGNIAFVRDDVRGALGDHADDAALGTMVAALEDYAQFLVRRQPRANDDFALGREAFEQMLRHTVGSDIELAGLEAALQADLDRNLAAMEAAAREIDPARPVAQVVATVAAEKPAAGDVLKVATEQSTRMRRFLLDHKIVTIPSEDAATVAESPAFMRWNAAFLSSKGPFDAAGLPSFYYISPPDPGWPPEKQNAYIPGTADLLFITIHEVWPGHFLHGLHIRNNESRILKSLRNYANGEGWAHYAEEMMWAQGVSTDPKVHIGQLQNALLRNVRSICAIGLHIADMTVAQCKQLFLDKAYQDEANAEQQAVRGTFDPMYLAYTAGKLVILKLREDVRAKQAKAGEHFDLGGFHDTLLSFAAAPLSEVRRQMLGEELAKGPVL